jgi:hypothetical protein
MSGVIAKSPLAKVRLGARVHHLDIAEAIPPEVVGKGIGVVAMSCNLTSGV